MPPPSLSLSLFASLSLPPQPSISNLMLSAYVKFPLLSKNSRVWCEADVQDILPPPLVSSLWDLQKKHHSAFLEWDLCFSLARDPQAPAVAAP